MPFAEGAIALISSVVVVGLLAWAAVMLALWSGGRALGSLTGNARLLSDLVRLTGRLARDSTVPASVRVRLWLLLAYIAVPIDLVPDFVPVVGYADDVAIVVWTLRSAIRRAGSDVLTRHWPGTPDGLDAVRRLCGVTG